MTVQPIGGTPPVSPAQALQATPRPEATERPGGADHDGDSDDRAVKVELSKQS